MERSQTDTYQSPPQRPRVTKQAACILCHSKKLKCNRAPDQIRCERCTQFRTECVIPNHPLGRQKGVKNKRKGVDKALHQIEQAIKKSKNATGDETEVGDPVKVISHLQDLLDKAQRQLANQKPVVQPDSSGSNATPNLSQSQQPSAARLSTDDVALDDAENPLQLLARASDLQLVPPAIAQHRASNSPNSLSSPGTVYMGHPARGVDSFFVPIKASLDVGPELDPVDLGLITFDDANNLFAFFYDHLSHTRWGFDPAIHTVSFVRAQSSFLFTSILAASASFLPSTEALSRRLSSHVKILAQNVIARRHRSVEIVLAFMANVPWMAPGRILGDDDTCLYISMALSIALDLSLNKVATLPQTATGGQFARADCIDARRALSMDGFEDVMANSEYGRRLLRRRERTWIALFVVERGVCLARGRSYSVPITALLENCDKWHLADRDIADPRDGQMNSMAILRRDLDELLRKVRRACDDYRKTDNGIDIARSIESMIESFYDSWFAMWALSISEGDSQSLPPYVEILVTHTRLSTYSSVMNHPTAPTEVRSFFRSEALSSALNVMRTAIQGESRLKSMPNNTVIMIAFAACSALSLGLATTNQNENRLAPSVLNLITETADVLERIGATPRHRNGASVLYGRFLHELVARARGQPDGYHTPQQQQQHQPPPLQSYHTARNYSPSDSRAFTHGYLPHHPPSNISPPTRQLRYPLGQPLQFSSMSGDQIVDAVNSVSLPMGEAGTMLPDYQNFPLNEMMLWEWFDNSNAADLNFIMAARLPRTVACPALLSRRHLYTSIRTTTAKTTSHLRQKPVTYLLPRRAYTTTSARYSEPLAPRIVRGESKLFSSADDAVADLKSGSTILSAGFGLCGVAETLIQAISRRGAKGLHSLTAVSNNAGVAKVGGLALLADAGQISRLIISFLGNNKTLEKNYLTGKIAIELCPQGTIAERIRAGGAGIPAFYTPTGVSTLLQEGQIPVRLSSDGKVLEHGKKREVREFKGRKFLMEEAITGDVAILRAWKADEAGNCVFRYTTKAFGPIMAKAATLTIVETEEIVPVGSIDPNDVDLPGIFVDRIVPATAEKHIEIRKLREADNGTSATKETPEIVQRNRIAKRAAKELKEGYYVNLGVGIPTLATSFLPAGRTVWVQSENGILGMGPYPAENEVDPDIVNAGKETVTLVPGASTFDSSESFGMIRGGHVDVSILGALQVAANGDLANYMIPGKVFKGMGGAMDLVSNPNNTKIVVATSHVAKDGSSKIVQKCDLPLTGAKCVSTIITDLCVFEVDREKGELTLTELAPGVDVDEIRAKTDAEFRVAENLESME